MLKQLISLLAIGVLLFFLYAIFFVSIAKSQEGTLNKESGTSLAQLILREIESGKKELANLNLSYSPKKITYTQIIRRSDGVEFKGKTTDFAWKDIGLKLINLDNDQTKIVKIRKSGSQLINLQAQSGFIISVQRRPSGISWNGLNTAFEVRNLKDNGRWVVILNRYPYRLKNGKREDYVYGPYASGIHLPELNSAGMHYLKQKIFDSIAELYSFSESRADALENELMQNSGSFGFDVVNSTYRLILIEQTDPFEFYEFVSGRLPLSPFERVNIIVAMNGGKAYSVTSSSAGAYGLMQFTNKSRRDRFGKLRMGTWDVIRSNYSWARLPAFNYGTRSHREAIKAAILLQDYNLKMLKRALGEGVGKDPALEYYLAAGYNGGIGPVIEAIKKSYKKNTNWRYDELPKLKKTSESLDYLDKLDYLINTPQ
ncbi:MAG: hypothetical protein AAB784_00425 [Patescibacteria group bacterium]